MIPVSKPWLPPFEEYANLLKQVWESHMLSNFGRFAKELERKASVCIGSTQVRVVTSCDLGLMLGIACLGLPAGSPVVVPSYTFNSTINAVLWNSLQPVFCDIDENTFNIDPTCVDRLAKKARLIIGTHVFGNPCDVDALRTICDASRMPLIFDSAHGLGSSYRGQKVGTLGDIEVFSLSGTKLVTSAEGGIISCKDEELLEQLEYRRNYGFIYDYESRFLGLNGKISELNAALGCLTIDKIESAMERRNEIAERYRANLLDIPGIGLQSVHQDDVSAFKDFAITCERDRDGLAVRLADMGVQTKKYFYPAHLMKAYKQYNEQPLPKTEALYDKVLCLPIYNDLTDAEIDQVCEIIGLHFRHGGV
ncbi:MAG: DegT/DnrJ/EryC1/StrS family aminotransferase [Candidatus Geothermincolia bacterium]